MNNLKNARILFLLKPLFEAIFLKHLFFDETKSTGPCPLLCLIAVDEENRKKISEVLALPNENEFGLDAFRTLYQIEGGEIKNPEYSFRRMQRAYYMQLTFQDKIKAKVTEVLENIHKLDFEVYLSMYDLAQAKAKDWSQTQLKHYYTTALLKYGVAKQPYEILSGSMICADYGFYNSKTLHVVKSVFRTKMKIGVCEEDDSSLKYEHGKLLDKVIEIKSSCDLKPIQLADLVAGVCGRMIYKKDKESDFFYGFVADKIKVLLDNRSHKPNYVGSFLQPAPLNAVFDKEIKKPDLRKITVASRNKQDRNETG